MAADPLRSKALACLREARVTVLRVRVTDDWKPHMVFARVRSSRERSQTFYRVHLLNGSWSCTCTAGERRESCPHVTAVALVTTDGAAA